MGQGYPLPPFLILLVAVLLFKESRQSANGAHNYPLVIRVRDRFSNASTEVKFKEDKLLMFLEPMCNNHTTTVSLNVQNWNSTSVSLHFVIQSETQFSSYYFCSKTGNNITCHRRKTHQLPTCSNNNLDQSPCLDVVYWTATDCPVLPKIMWLSTQVMEVERSNGSIVSTFDCSSELCAESTTVATITSTEADDEETSVSPDDESDDSSPSVAVIAGSVCGILTVVIIVIVILFLVRRRKRDNDVPGRKKHSNWIRTNENTGPAPQKTDESEYNYIDDSYFLNQQYSQLNDNDQPVSYAHDYKSLKKDRDPNSRPAMPLPASAVSEDTTSPPSSNYLPYYSQPVPSENAYYVDLVDYTDGANTPLQTQSEEKEQEPTPDQNATGVAVQNPHVNDQALAETENVATASEGALEAGSTPGDGVTLSDGQHVGEDEYLRPGQDG